MCWRVSRTPFPQAIGCSATINKQWGLVHKKSYIIILFSVSIYFIWNVQFLVIPSYCEPNKLRLIHLTAYAWA